MSTTAAIPTPNRSRPRSRLNSLKSLGSGDDLPRFPFGGSKRSPSQGRPPSSYVGPLGPPEPDELPHVSVFRKSPARFYWTQVTARVQGDSRSRQVGFTTPECNRHSATAQMEGVFVHISSPPEGPEIPAKMRAATSTMHRHAFLSTTQALPIDKTLGPRRSSSRLREAIAATTRPRRERRPSQTSISGILRPFPFSIEVPPSARPGAELPQTFCAAADGLAGTRARAFVERSEIMYKLIATWETDDGTDEMSVGAPIILEPDPEFESLDGRSMEPESWIEHSLRSERPIPFKCAVALPDTPSFSRSVTIPYYVVFTTTPRSPTLTHEILADATISVSLLRQINIDMPPVSPSVSSASSSDEASSFILTHKTKLMKRVVNSAPPVLSRRQPKPVPPPRPERPEVSLDGFSETRSLYMDVYVGFPKRPRARLDPGQKHPPLTAHTLLPDGLYKAKMQLNRNMLPSIDWEDLNVKYFLEVSVVFGQDETRARVPIRVV
ncbi:predicted protein [Postia placenta Mad-698-R]|nr:predicted protein [Postia placenta Mad-698-R]